MRASSSSAKGGHPPQVGSVDPERRTSPIQSDPQQSFELLREQVGDEAGGCYFNDLRYGDGALVLSGSTCLKCESGLWVEVPSTAPWR